MIINDRVYGEIEITEPVLLELIQTKPLQRLKNVAQAGISKYIIKNRGVTRYEHSLGVMILLKKLGASLEEQIAGLLHDIPHTAFSHVADFVFTNKEHSHEFHERFHEKIIMESEIPKIIEKHGFNITRLLNEHNFPLLEQNLPNLCADRIDYTLRDMTSAKGFKEDINTYIKHFIVHNNEIIFSNKNTALLFAQDFIMMDDYSWSHPIEVAYYQLLADALKIALEENIITQEDLFTDDNTVFKLLQESKNTHIQKQLAMLTPNLKISLNEKDYDFFARNKVRYVNPKFLDENNEVDYVFNHFPEFKEEVDQHNEKVKKGLYIKIDAY